MPYSAPGPVLVISLDFELMWGVRDHHTKDTYGANVLGVREAIPCILETFSSYGIRATWATVGFLFCETKEELLASLPERRPNYTVPALSNYSYLGEIGENERKDPYYFGMSLLKDIQACPGQEIGTHTFSHFYCLEPGVTDEDFQADINAAITVAKRRGVELRSFVFPRNQYDANKITLCRKAGFRVYRGNEQGWIYRPTADRGQTLLRRGLRLTDSYLNVSGHNIAFLPEGETIVNVPSGRFLRPYSPRLKRFDPLRLSRIFRSMDAAARSNAVFHLWWHPHNFGRHLEENMAILKQILEHFVRLRETTGMRSLAMGEMNAVA